MLPVIRHGEYGKLSQAPVKQLPAFFVYWKSSKPVRLKVNIEGQGQQLCHDPNPVYLAVTLDRTLSYRHHNKKTARKLQSWNNLLIKLDRSTWGALLTSWDHLRRLYLARAEHRCSVWQYSAHSVWQYSAHSVWQHSAHSVWQYIAHSVWQYSAHVNLVSGKNLPFQQILPTLDFFYLPDCLHNNGTGPDLSRSSFYF